MQAIRRQTRLLSRSEVEEIYGVPKRFLERATRKGGPRYIKIGRLVRYRAVDVEAWIECNAVDGGI